LSTPSIGIDGFNLSLPKGSGIATYAFNLNHCLRNLGHETHIIYGPEQGLSKNNLLNEISLFDVKPPSTSALRQAASVARDIWALTSPLGRRATAIRPNGEVITRQVARQAPACDALWAAKDLFHRANRAYSALGRVSPLRFDEGAAPDVVHWTCPLPIQAMKRPNLYTIHDLVPLRLPFTTLDNKRRFYSLCQHICAIADKVVTVSEHSKRDMVRILGVDEARVSVTHQSVDLPLAMTDRPEDEVAAEVDGVFGLDWRGYFIFFGAIEPKKNLARVIEGYLASGVDSPLVIIGGNAWLDDEDDNNFMLYDDLVEWSVLRDGVIRRADRVRVYDYLPFSLLVSLIRGAKATLLPSLYEGFGLPILESMLLRTPVLSSTEGSIPEVAGDAAILVDPYDSQAIRKGIVALDSDADLRADLIERGLKQSAKFSPAVYRDKLAELYRPFS
jgi:glycosyltransferase involved in cell wall biosynthesis